MMNEKNINVLILEDSQDDAELLVAQLQAFGMSVDWRQVDNEADFRAALEAHPDLILADYALPGFNGEDALKIRNNRHPDIPFILVSGTIGEELAVETIKLGADDYLMKDRLTRLAPAVELAIKNRRLREEKRAAEEALQLSENRYKSFFIYGSDEVLIIDPEGKIEYKSPSANPFLGYQPEEIHTKHIWDLVHAEDLEVVRNLLAQLQQDVTVHPRKQFRLLHQNGNWVWVEGVGTNLLSEPSVRGIVINYHDVSRQRQALEDLRQSEKYFRSLIENASDVITVIDETAIIRYESPSVERVLGYHPDELVGRPVLEYIHEDELETVANIVIAAFSIPAERISAEFRFLHKDGSYRYLDAVGRSAVDHNGQLIGIINSRDITERKQAEETIRQHAIELERRVEERTIELIHANRAKDEFLATMSHELRTPLNSILGFSETLLEQRRGPLNEKQEQYIQLVHSSGQHLLGLINDILEVSKIEAGKLELHPDIFSVKELCESSLNFVKELATSKSISLEFQSDPAIRTLFADPQRMKQILINLLNNAVKFTPQNGTVRLEFALNPEKDQILISVTDDGVGIAQENLSKLFTPFTQLDSSLSRHHEGTGLGLVLVLRFTEMHGGSVTVESEPNKGSRFTISLPWTDENTKTEHKVSNTNDSKDASEELKSKNILGVRVLLAEDILSNLLVIQDYLTNYGYEVIVAQNGIEAINKAEENSPNIILMDIQMPKMDGLEAIRRLRAKPEFASVPIIALTALAMPGDRKRFLEAGANEYISKPVNLRSLLKTIETLTNQDPEYVKKGQKSG